MTNKLRIIAIGALLAIELTTLAMAQMPGGRDPARRCVIEHLPAGRSAVQAGMQDWSAHNPGATHEQIRQQRRILIRQWGSDHQDQVQAARAACKT